MTTLGLSLLAFMAVPEWGAARRESAAFDEIAHIGAGLSYLRRVVFFIAGLVLLALSA